MSIVTCPSLLHTSGLVIGTILLSASANVQSASTGTVSQEPCVANITKKGSVFSSRTFKTFQEFDNVTKSSAFDQLVPAIASGGWTISFSSKESGVVTSWAKPNYAEGETESLSVVVRETGERSIRVELTYIAPALAAVPAGALNDQFCQLMSEVESLIKP